MKFADNPVIAHRGAWKKNGFPENSIASLKEAIRLGCAGSEFDIWMTADDSLVINHDPVFDKMEIEKVTYSELLKGSLSNGEKIPTLREYVAAGMSNNETTRLILEIKPSNISIDRSRKVAMAVVGLVKEMKAASYAGYISFEREILRTILQADASANVQYLKGELAPGALHADGIQGLDYHFSVFHQQEEWINRAKELKMVLNAWTVNEEKEMQWLLDRKFDYITTNEPELLFGLLKNSMR